MTLVILQPAGNQGGREHYVDTIENLVDIKSCTQFVSPKVLTILETAHPSGKAGMWGVVPGKRDVNVKKWERIAVGDLVLFAADKKIRASAVVAAKFSSEQLAKHLWKTNSEGETWEYMYSLDEIRELNITYEEFNQVVGYQKNNVIQGFTVMDEAKSNLFLDYYGLRSEKHFEDVPDEEFEDAIVNLDGDLDRRASSWHRKEQSKARKHLLKGKSVGKCQLCGLQMNSDFLIAAHIKRRSECEDHEKRDIDGVMMLACKFGCDYLYEVGYIGVQNGVLAKSTKLNDSKAIAYLSAFEGRNIEAKESQKKYFEWHLQNRFIK